MKSKSDDISLADLESLLTDSPELMDKLEFPPDADPAKYIEEQIKIEIKAAIKRIRYIRSSTAKEGGVEKPYLNLWSKLVREIYQSLLDEGFTPAQSMTLTQAVVERIGIL